MPVKTFVTLVLKNNHEGHYEHKDKMKTNFC